MTHLFRRPCIPPVHHHIPLILPGLAFPPVEAWVVASGRLKSLRHGRTRRGRVPTRSRALRSCG